MCFDIDRLGSSTFVVDDNQHPEPDLLNLDAFRVNYVCQQGITVTNMQNPTDSCQLPYRPCPSGALAEQAEWY
jgi:hypothetical protein